jgi:hypothetical protein
MVGLVDDYKVPRLGRQNFRHAGSTLGQLATGQQDRIGVPGVARGRRNLSEVVPESVPVVARDVEGELLVEFFLPLA